MQRVLVQAGLPRPGAAARASMVEAYVPFIVHTLARFPTLTAARLYVMVRERVARGNQDEKSASIKVRRMARAGGWRA